MIRTSTASSGDRFSAAFVALAMLVEACFLAPLAWADTAPPRYQLHFLGLFDDEPVADGDGRFDSSFGNYLDTNGNMYAIIGRSDRYRGDEKDGYSGWHFDVKTGRVTPIGLFLDTTTTLNTTPRAVSTTGMAIGSTALGSTVPRPDHAWVFDNETGQTKEIGLFDRPDLGTASAENGAADITTDGFVVGGWDSGTSGAPRYTWAYDPLTHATTRIGLFDSAHLNPVNQNQKSTFLELSPLGHVVGTAERINSPGGGTSVWQYDRATETTTRLGFAGGIYTRATGEEVSVFSTMNELGFVGGGSFAEWSTPTGNRSGFAGWIYDPVDKTIQKVGLAQPGSTNAADFRSDSVSYISPAGFALGGSSADSNVNAVWIQDLDAGSPQRLGFFDATHTLSNGGQQSSIKFYDDHGRVAGESRRATGTTPYSAWCYDHSAGETLQIGLMTPEYLPDGPGGIHESRVLGMNGDGFVIGVTRKVGFDYSAWVFDPNTKTTTRIGERAALRAGIRYSWPKAINSHVQVVGGDDAGLWFYDPDDRGDGNLISPQDTGHYAPWFDFLSESGYVAGHSQRTNGVSNRGQSAWLFDSNTRATTILDFSVSTNGQAYSEIDYLGEDGTVLGFYDLYDGNTLMGHRPFYWNVVHGFHDISDLIAVDDPQFEWTGFVGERSGYVGVLRSADPRLITGYALLANGTSVPFALTIVPEPPGYVLLTIADVILFHKKRGRDGSGFTAGVRLVERPNQPRQNVGWSSISSAGIHR